MSFRAEYLREARRRLEGFEPGAPLGDADVADLPRAVVRYLRVAGALGQPRVHHFRARWKGRIRSGPSKPWMPFTAEQLNFVAEPARFFLMRARRGGLPVGVYHAYHSGAATMRVRLLSLVPLVHASGPEMRQAETVTVFNDLCVLAPGALIDPRIHWNEIDERRVRARFTVGPHTIGADLLFDETGALVDFVSDDRLASLDGGRFERRRWSTPLSGYRSYGPLRAASRGTGRWHVPEGDYAYIELELVDLELNGAAPS